MKTNAKTSTILLGLQSMLGVEKDNFIIEVYMPDIIEMDMEMFSRAGINILKNAKVGDTIDLCGLNALLTMNEGITIKIK
jgi:hypothetical protein